MIAVADHPSSDPRNMSCKVQTLSYEQRIETKFHLRHAGTRHSRRNSSQRDDQMRSRPFSDTNHGLVEPEVESAVKASTLWLAVRCNIRGLGGVST